MYECEKCVHEELCDQPGRRLWGTLSGEKECSDFKDRNKYVEVVHGRWEWKPIQNHTWILTCSVCGSEEGTSESYNYCPNCGANMMDGDGNG